METQSEHEDATVETELVFETHLDAPPEKVWRAVTEPALLARWLPELARDEKGPATVSLEPLFSAPGEQVHYRWYEIGLPEVQTEVRFGLDASEDGGTDLTITHRVTAVTSALPRPANSNTKLVMRAA